VFVSIKPLHVSVFFTTIFRESSAVLRAVTIPPAGLPLLSLYYYVVCGRMCMSSACVWCSCLLVICLWTVSYCVLRNSSQADHQQTRTPNTRRWHTHAATYCVIIRTQRTQISGRNSNGTKHSGGPLEDGREKRPKHVGVLYLTNTFLTFYWF
jgi:hypothetical protein